MWPWGHLAAAYLVYSLGHRLLAGRVPGDRGALVAVAASQAPDLVDKPLAWTFSVLPTGRSLGHSLVVAVLVLPVVWWVADRRGARGLAAAASVGYLVGFLTDAVYPLVEGNPKYVTFLAWPLLELPAYEIDQSFAAHFALIGPSPEFAFELLLVALASLLWHVDGRPGLGTVRAWSLGFGRGETE
jgi:hypothetical protein